MRKLIAAITLTLILAGSTARAAEPRGRERTPRDRDNPIVRMIKIVKRVLTTSELPVPPLP